MSEKIKPALSAEEWASLAASVRESPTTYISYHGDDPAIAIAEANYKLPYSDRGKITRTWVNWLREEADVLKRDGAGAGALMAMEIADGLERYLPPEGA